MRRRTGAGALATIPLGIPGCYITLPALAEEIEERIRSLTAINIWFLRYAPPLIAKTKLRLGMNPSSPGEAIEMMMPRIRRIVYLLTIEESIYRENVIVREDLISDAWLETAHVFERWQKRRNDPIDPVKGPFFSYCDTALWRMVRAAVRRGKWAAEHFEDSGILEKTAGTGEEQTLDAAQQGWNKARIARARKSLSPDEQAFVDDFLAHDGEPPREMAERLNMPVDRVYTLEKRTFRKLRRRLQKPKRPNAA